MEINFHTCTIWKWETKRVFPCAFSVLITLNIKSFGTFKPNYIIVVVHESVRRDVGCTRKSWCLAFYGLKEASRLIDFEEASPQKIRYRNSEKTPVKT